jgi:streptogramin lyase
VLVTDWDCVLKYSSHGRLLAQFGRAGDGEFAGASAIALGGGGNIFVATGRQSIEKLSPSGYVLATWPVYLNDYFSLGPGSIAVDALGQVYSTGGVSETGIVQKRAPDGRLLAHWTVKGRLSGIAVGRRGNVFVGTYRFPDPAPIYKLSPTGQPLATWSYPHVTEARAIAVDRRGDLYLACDNDDAIVKLSSSGRELAIWK